MVSGVERYHPSDDLLLCFCSKGVLMSSSCRYNCRSSETFAISDISAAGIRSHNPLHTTKSEERDWVQVEEQTVFRLFGDFAIT